LDNLATAITLFEAALALGWTHDWSSIAGVSQATWPARMQLIHGTPQTLLDAAHNPLAFDALRDHLESCYRDRRVVLVFGTSDKEKAYRGIDLFAPIVDHIVLTSGFYRSVVAGLYELPLAPHLLAKITFAPSPLRAFEFIRSKSLDFDLVVVTGSIFLVGDWMSLLTSGSLASQQV
jgi:dihydrofolate synthase/folylpolyglutamate synthase